MEEWMAGEPRFIYDENVAEFCRKSENALTVVPFMPVIDRE